MHIRVGGVETRSSREHNSTFQETNLTVQWVMCQLLIFTPIFLARKSVAWNQRGDGPTPQPRATFTTHMLLLKVLKNSLNSRMLEKTPYF